MSWYTKNRKKFDYTILGIALLLAVLALTPKQWAENITTWWNQIAASKYFYFTITSLAIACAFFAGRYTGKTAVNSRPVVEEADTNKILAASDNSENPISLIPYREFAKMLETSLESGKYSAVKIFGYTHETYQKHYYDVQQYSENISVQILNRSWIPEKADEERYNQQFEGLNRRKWNKSAGIRSRALEPRAHLLCPLFRYYDFTHPIVKGVILSGRGHKEAYLSFYRWEQTPRDGGSQFKGSDVPMVHIIDDTLTGQAFIETLESQFDLVFSQKSKSAEEIKKEEHSHK